MFEHVDNYFEQGLARMDAGDYEGAIALFDNAIKLSLGDIAEVYVCRGEAFGYLGRWQDAEQSINEALRHQPYLATAYNERGNVRRFQGQIEDAIADYTMAIHIDATYYEAYYNRALAYEECKQFDDAEDDLTHTLAFNPMVSQAYEARGRVRAVLYDFDGAIADLSQYLRMGGGRQYDNHSETQGFLLTLYLQRFFWRLIPAQWVSKTPKSSGAGSHNVES